MELIGMGAAVPSTPPTRLHMRARTGRFGKASSCGFWKTQSPPATDRVQHQLRAALLAAVARLSPKRQLQPTVRAQVRGKGQAKGATSRPLKYLTNGRIPAAGIAWRCSSGAQFLDNTPHSGSIWALVGGRGGDFH
ncbi:MAG: hypothetical protein KGL39_58080, partial [Patescibacteria group bacterium]|nr:hypothetical protein [Patescibacteria group bacterium]